ncbi:small cysteine-rich secretory protein SCR99 [Phytophthora cinnamomi]|uniref:small cysteine-rich secretory protein SCR99 n=1 Tax=Phytophthora cinnamomi TaxID=4785 RepID=UPI002A27DB54|nr:small cysteine-rich secretory protein SCR99 [Phytophthora cinnamomi]KAJ8556704.1 hypothetical protein ON010_g9262 [Phytophthora cinnamomi]
MKFQIVIAALVTLLLPVNGAGPARLQCAGGVPDTRGEGSGIIYENSGFLTANFTQNACTTAGGSIDRNKKGNEKCCIVPEFPDTGIRAFNGACGDQQAGSNYPKFRPFARGC